MNSQLTTETTALIASQSLSLVEGTTPFPPKALYEFWSHGQEHIKRHRKKIEPLTNENFQTGIAEDELEAIFKDFFAEEMLIRIVTAIFTAADQRRNQCQAEPIARSLFLSLLEVKRLLLLVLVSEKHLSLDALKRINRSRRSIERWTDLLQGQLVLRYGIEEFAHDAARAKEFGEDQSSDANATRPVHVWDLILAGLRTSIPSGHSSETGDHWKRMLGAILACYPAECFNHSATMRSIHRIRIQRSGLHPETNPNRQPEHLNSLIGRSLVQTDSAENTSLNPQTNTNSTNSMIAPSNQSISFSTLRKRDSNESSS